MAAKSKTTVHEIDRRLTVTRRYTASSETVFAMWTDPAHITHWWGPVGFSTTTQAFDFRPGGVWKHVMHGPDGKDYDNEVHFREIVANERITYSHVSAPYFDVVVTFKDVAGETEMTFEMTFPTEAISRALGEAKATEGLRDTVDRLNEYVAETFVISRTFGAPRDVVWAAWTEENRLRAWFGPKGVPIVKAGLDFRTGGTFHYCLRTPDGGDMWGLWRFTEIDPPNRIVMTASFSDAAGGITRAPFFDGKWPLETTSTVTFADAPDGGTTVTLTARAINATDIEREAFKANFLSLAGGWGGTFDQLGAYVSAE